MNYVIIGFGIAVVEIIIYAIVKTSGNADKTAHNIEVYLCPHGHKDSDDCPDCSH